MQLPPLGWAAGVLGRTDPTPERLKTYLAAGADAVEIHVSAAEMLAGGWTHRLAGILDEFRWVSLHAPKVDANERSEVFERVRQAADVLPIQRVTVHPEEDMDFLALDEAGDLFAIENMDRRKVVGTTRHLFEALSRTTSLPAVLDLQHVWEHDPSMRLGRDLIAVMGSRLSHLHISGCDETRIHAPLTEATNAAAVLNFYAQRELLLPVILEGEYGQVDDPVERLRDELELVREMLRARVEITGARG